jgi:hypothetical protein
LSTGVQARSNNDRQGLWVPAFAGTTKDKPSLRGAKRRSNPFFLCGTMDCFAALAMTAKHTPAISRRIAPELCLNP